MNIRKPTTDSVPVYRGETVIWETGDGTNLAHLPSGRWEIHRKLGISQAGDRRIRKMKGDGRSELRLISGRNGQSRSGDGRNDQSQCICVAYRLNPSPEETGRLGIKTMTTH